MAKVWGFTYFIFVDFCVMLCILILWFKGEVTFTRCVQFHQPQ